MRVFADNYSDNPRAKKKEDVEFTDPEQIRIQADAIRNLAESLLREAEDAEDLADEIEDEEDED